MNITLDYLRGRRVWVVNNFSVYGEFSAVAPLLLWTEIGDTSKRIIFAREILGGLEQIVSFSNLYDIKGNQLPSSISFPKVLLLQKNEVACLVVGPETNANFKIAKLTQSQTVGIVDLVIIENG
ncbi:MAG: hypothetical protein RBG1_1C00001G1392 [candidate division Zixibacteria bacterium RBG-1]|nr:MAG: hypothetical protein RBG1_1C00001G1392 [candidate division Zixibacteria bacterium RBG-1]OGC85549.1 MAG: hypothetical protein A2V73_06305 [candidate division Zixibacteria bacterium RBG_19FT_COMBO_42_43]